MLLPPSYLNKLISIWTVVKKHTKCDADEAGRRGEEIQEEIVVVIAEGENE